jgi:outer membrane receptor protein involved in Fe transport
VEAYGQNLFNSNAYLNKNDAQFIVTEVPLRPRTIAVRISYKFSDK